MRSAFPLSPPQVGVARRLSQAIEGRCQSLLATKLKVPLRLVPTSVKAAIAATAINAAINAYSVAGNAGLVPKQIRKGAQPGSPWLERRRVRACAAILTHR
jgi:hypothetical protein